MKDPFYNPAYLNKHRVSTARRKTKFYLLTKKSELAITRYLKTKEWGLFVADI